MKGTTRKYNKILKGDNEGTKTIRKSLETENSRKVGVEWRWGSYHS